MRPIILLLALSCCFQCQRLPENTALTVKFHSNDPFAATMTSSQFFDLDAGADQVREGKNGTVLVFPKGCFLDARGRVFQQKVRIELTEALRLEDMVLSNLTTTSDGKPLETGGMIYFNAVTAATGAQLYINPENPIFIDIPVKNKKPGMMAFQGFRDSLGDMNWLNPLPLNNWLTPVDIFSLDFLPEGFEVGVEQSLPLGRYRTPSPELTDSLYYSLSASSFSEALKGFVSTHYNEPYYNQNNAVINGVYADDAYLFPPVGHTSSDDSLQPARDLKAIDPAMIKVIKSEKFQNTLLATREFEKRLQLIFKTCNNAVLEVYIKNLDKNLWECDQMAARLLEGDAELSAGFHRFAMQGLTTVKGGGKTARLLGNYYEQELKRVKQELADHKKALLTVFREKNKEAGQLANTYKKLLFQREKHRMESYGFEWTQTGWINVDIGTEPKTLASGSLEVQVSNGLDFDRVYVYVIYPTIKSIYRLNASNQVNFYTGNADEREMLMRMGQFAHVVAIGYKGEVPAFATTDFETAPESTLTLDLTPVTPEVLKKELAFFNGYTGENQIGTDLEYMKNLYAEEQRQKTIEEEVKKMGRLWDLAFPCSSGYQLFEANCASCHGRTMKSNLTGPALYGVEERWKKYPQKDLYAWIRNSQELIARGHPRAVDLWGKWKPTLMNRFDNLSDAQIAAILAYIRRVE